MISIVKLVLAWLIAIAATALIAGLSKGREGLPSWDGILGLGLIVGLPMLLFAFAVAWPLSALVSRHLPPAAGLIIYPFLVAAAAWLISAPLFPEGWKGAQQALVLFGFAFGIGWSLLSLVITRSSATT